MQELAVRPRQQPVGINLDEDDWFFGGDAIRRSHQHVMILPALPEGLARQNHVAVHQNGGLPNHNGPPNQNGPANHNGLANLNGLAHVVPGRPPLEEERLQREEQDDLNAVRVVLNLPIHENIITASHFRRVLTSLLAMLPNEGPYRIPYFQVHYARILERMARVMAVLTTVMYESTHWQHPTRLGYKDVLQWFQEMSPELPFEYGKCLHMLCDQMTVAASLTQGADGVFILNNRDEFASCLRSLATRLLRSL